MSHVLDPLKAAVVRFYIGTYTGKSGSKGIYHCTLNVETGELGPVQLAAEALSPNFLAASPDGRFVYAATLSSGGSVAAYRVEPDGQLTLLNQQQSGKNTCHVWIDSTGRHLFAANYSDGSIASFQVLPDGSLSPRVSLVTFEGRGTHPSRQEAPHAHSIFTGPDDRFVYSCDLGTDNVWIHKLDATQSVLTAHDTPSASLPAGSGPRHLAFHPAGGFVYAANELNQTVTVFAHDSDTGSLAPLQHIPTLPDDVSSEGVTVAAIFCHPTGKWLYVTNRGHDSIAVYAIANDGMLSTVEIFTSTVNCPRGFALDPTGNWLVLAGERDHRIHILKIDAATGKLSATDQFAQTGAPVCILFPPPNLSLLP